MYEHTFNPDELLVSYQGIVDYPTSWKIQKSLSDIRSSCLISDCLMIHQHPHTYTIGKRGTISDILLPLEDLLAKGIHAYSIERGGGTTYHGPGQIMVYPIMDTRPYGGPAKYVGKIEDTILLTLSEFGLIGSRLKGSPGVWIGERKIASIGLKITKGITTHGFSININNDLSYFDHIVTCGVANLVVTSLEHETRQNLDISEVASAIIRSFCYVFQKDLKNTPEQYFLGLDTNQTITPLALVV